MSEGDLYAGREQTLVKHFILRTYLDKFAHIVGSKWNAITYIDCFSGPWNAQSPNFDDSSFNIALSALRKARADLREGLKKDFELRCFFLEKDAGAYDQLRRFTQAVDDAEIVTENAPLEASVEQVLAFVRRRQQDAFPFVFIDPTGWTGFALEVIAPLLRLKPGEILINFMTGHVLRFAEHPDEAIRQSFDRLFGPIDYRARIASLTGQDREDELVRCYCDAVRHTGNFDHVCPAIVLHPEDNRAHFHLLYATRNPRGLEVFKQVEKKAMQEMEAARGMAQQRKRINRTQQQELAFTGETSGRHYDGQRKRFLLRAKDHVRELFRIKPILPYDEAWSAALSEPLVWESDLKDWVARWKKDGWIEISGMRLNERVPKRGAGHELVWKRDSPR